MKRLIMLLLFSIELNLLFSADISIVPNLNINAGFSAVVHNNNIVFAADDTGSITVWDADDRKLLRTFPASRLKIAGIICRPGKDEIAIIETNELNTHIISVFNWLKGTKIFSRVIKSRPLDFQYSPLGNYLVFSTNDWNSMRFLNADDGEFLNLLNTGFGIVSGFYIAKNEKILVTYSATGSLQSWEIKTGSKRAELPAPANLTSIAFHKDLDYIAGYDGKRLLIINPANGRAIQEYSVEGIKALQVYEKRIIASSPNEIHIWDYNYENNSLFKTYVPGAAYEGVINSFVYDDSIVYAACGNGLFLTRYFSSIQYSFGKLEPLVISSIAADGDTLVLAGPEKTVAVSHPLLEADFGSTFFPEIYVYVSAFSEAPGIIHYSGKDFFSYNTKGETGKYSMFSPSYGYGDIYDEFDSPIQTVRSDAKQLLALSKSGKVQIFQPLQNNRSFSYSSFGIHDAALTSAGRILTARTKTPQLNSSIVSINPLTKETILLENGNEAVNKLAINSQTDNVYSLGYEYIGTEAYTVAKNHGKEGLEEEQTLQSVLGSYPDSLIIFDEESSTLFVSMNNSNIHAYRSSIVKKYENPDGMPKQLLSNRGVLISLNSNNTISFWSVLSGRYLGCFYFFNDDSWIFVSSEDKYACQGHADLYLNGFDGDREISLRNSKIMLNIR